MKLVVVNNSIKIHARTGTLLINALQRKALPVNALCAGNGRCGSCRVKIIGKSRPADEIEKIFIPHKLLKMGYRLACRYRIEDDIKIQIPLIKKRKRMTPSDAGFALDLGTTLIKGAGIDISSGRLLEKAKTQNLQNSFGGDVVSRIGEALKGNYQKLRNLMMLSIKNIKNQIGIKKPILTVVVGNPVMLSFYLNKPVAGLGSYPFKSEIKGLILKKNPVRIVLPIIKGFVGSDTVAGIVAADLYNKKKNFLYIDLGTNGEVVLIKNDSIIATSTAAGPAFEGVGLSCGSPAVDGAIDRITYNKGFRIKTINNKEPTGICASGIIDLLAVLLNLHWLTPDGRLLKKPRFNNITIEQGDVRKLQLAIGAIHTGIKILLKKAKLSSCEIDGAVLTGEFGSHLDPSSLYRIGLLPRKIKKVYLKTDLPLKGAIMCIKDSRTIKQAEEISRKSEHLELALESDFERIFVQSMKFSIWN